MKNLQLFALFLVGLLLLVRVTGKSHVPHKHDVASVVDDSITSNVVNPLPTSEEILAENERMVTTMSLASPELMIATMMTTTATGGMTEAAMHPIRGDPSRPSSSSPFTIVPSSKTSDGDTDPASTTQAIFMHLPALIALRSTDPSIAINAIRSHDDSRYGIKYHESIRFSDKSSKAAVRAKKSSHLPILGRRHIRHREKRLFANSRNSDVSTTSTSVLDISFVDRKSTRLNSSH